jgi:hypothetical protein
VPIDGFQTRYVDVCSLINLYFAITKFFIKD